MKINYLLFIPLLLAFLIRLPSVTHGSPYIYDEDEGHHFNRVLRMTKLNNLDPQYFHKPSLHFYLRMPVTYFGIFIEKLKNKDFSINDINTKDKFGRGGYSYSSSHPLLLYLNRLLSLLLSLAVVFLTFKCTFYFTKDTLTSTFSSLIVALSPPLLSESTNIGVDPLVCFFGLLTTTFGICVYHRSTFKKLIICCLFAGFTVGSKYNAAPIFAVPFLALILAKDYNLKKIFTALVLPPLFFLLSSPYILITPKLFIKHISYELWHYSVAGHVGNEGTPGLSQVLHYFSWFSSSAVGLIILISALFGIFLLLKDRPKIFTVFFFFPIFYFLFMCTQKVNFVRNVYVLIPYLAILSGVTVYLLSSGLKYRKILLATLCLVQPLYLSTKLLQEKYFGFRDSRVITSNIFTTLPEIINSKVGIEGELAFNKNTLNRLNYQILPKDKLLLESLKFDYLASSEENIIGFKRLAVLGSQDLTRIPNDPKHSIFIKEK